MFSPIPRAILASISAIAHTFCSYKIWIMTSEADTTGEGKYRARGCPFNERLFFYCHAIKNRDQNNSNSW